MSGTHIPDLVKPLSNPRRGPVTKSFECRHAGVPCRGKFTGDTDEEVLEQAVEHAKEKHGVDLAQSRTLAAYAKSLIRDDTEGKPA
jgi:predicted small metal-binding protein